MNIPWVKWLFLVIVVSVIYFVGWVAKDYNLYAGKMLMALGFVGYAAILILFLRNNLK